MMMAAKEAGIAAVQTVFEPQCSAAFYAHNMMDKLPRDVETGDNMLVCDPGGGTGDFAVYQFNQSIRVGARVDLELIGKDGKVTSLTALSCIC